MMIRRTNVVLLLTIYIGDINCYECIENLNNNIASKEGLKEGNAPETFYMSHSERKRFNAQKDLMSSTGNALVDVIGR